MNDDGVGMERVEGQQRTLVPVDEVRAVVRDVLERHGVPAREATLVTHALVEADLRGQHSHGVFRLTTICARIEAGLIKPDGQPVTSRPAPAVLLVDAQRGLGHAVAWQVMESALDAARDTGICLAAVRNNNHIGMAGHYAEEAARRGAVLMVMTISEAMVRPHDGAEPLLGTNPIAVGFPAVPEPFVLDMSTSATAIGKILERQQRGEAIPDDWAVDGNGVATTDPTAALAGAINPFGGAKGYGLGLAVALLSGVLTGASAGPDVVGTLDAEQVCNKGDLFIAIDPALLPNHDDVAGRAGAYLDRIRGSRPAHGFDAVLVPGDRGRQARARALRDGVALSSEVWEEVRAL